MDSLMPFLQKEADRIVKAFLDDLNYLGLKCVRFVRDRSADESWIDQTGNLRSSIGYIVAKDGKIVDKGGFEPVNGPMRSSSIEQGSKIGENYAEELASRYPEGYALIVVAGMNYAAYVERIESKDVLAKGELFLKREMKNLVKKYRQ